MPNQMENMELLEAYSHYNKLQYRTPDEQDYIALLRLEILRRMDIKERA